VSSRGRIECLAHTGDPPQPFTGVSGNQPFHARHPTSKFRVGIGHYATSPLQCISHAMMCDRGFRQILEQSLLLSLSSKACLCREAVVFKGLLGFVRPLCQLAPPALQSDRGLLARAGTQ